MSLRLYTSCNNQCNVINVVNHNHNNIEVLNDITDINGSPYYGENRILTDKDGNTMLQYNYKNVKANKSISIIPLDENGNEINLDNEKVIIQNFKLYDYNSGNVNKIIFNVYANDSMSDWEYDKNNFIKDYQSIKIKKYFDINLNESDIYKYRFESDKINPNEYSIIDKIEDKGLYSDNAITNKLNEIPININNIIDVTGHDSGRTFSEAYPNADYNLVLDCNENTGFNLFGTSNAMTLCVSMKFDEAINISAINVMHNNSYSGVWYLFNNASYSLDNETYSNIQGKIINGYIILKKQIKAKYFKFTFELGSISPPKPLWYGLKLYNLSDETYNKVLIKTDEGFINPIESEYDSDNDKFKVHTDILEVLNKGITIEELTEEKTFKDNTFRIIDKIGENFSIVKKNNIGFTIYGTKKNYLLKYKNYLSLYNMNFVKNINSSCSIANNSMIKCILSFDYGITWRSYDFDTNNFKEIVIDETDDDNIYNQIISSGIDINNLKNIVFEDNFNIDNIKIIIAFKDNDVYSNSSIYKYINISYKTVGAYTEMVNNKEYKTYINGNEITILPLINIDELKTNIIFRDFNEKTVNINTVDTDKLIQAIKNNIELGLISPKDLALTYDKNLTYDENGNIIKISINDTTNNTSYYEILEYDNENFLTKESIYDSEDLLIGYKEISYDENGNIKNISAHNYNNLLIT